MPGLVGVTDTAKEMVFPIAGRLVHHVSTSPGKEHAMKVVLAVAVFVAVAVAALFFFKNTRTQQHDA
jgi:hypothetical protein